MFTLANRATTTFHGHYTGHPGELENFVDAKFYCETVD